MHSRDVTPNEPQRPLTMLSRPLHPSYAACSLPPNSEVNSTLLHVQCGSSHDYHGFPHAMSSRFHYCLMSANTNPNSVFPNTVAECVTPPQFQVGHRLSL